MFGYIVQCGRHKKVVITSRDLIHKVIRQFLQDVYNCNDEELKKDFKILWTNNSWTWRTLEGTFEPISIITT